MIQNQKMTLKVTLNGGLTLKVNQILIQSLMMIQTLVIKIQEEVKHMNVELLKVVQLPEVVKHVILFQHLKKILNKFRGHNESDKYQGDL